MATNYLKDVELSWRAKGLLTFLLNLPSDFEVTTQWLIEQSRDGPWTTRSTINQLTKLGYIRRFYQTDDKGRFVKYVILYASEPALLNGIYEKKIKELGGISFTKIVV